MAVTVNLKYRIALKHLVRHVEGNKNQTALFLDTKCLVEGKFSCFQLQQLLGGFCCYAMFV
jgi:hypothetical protein